MKITYPASISFKTDEEIKSFSQVKQKVREISTTKPALQKMLKGLIQSRIQREEKRSTKSTPIKKTAIETYISIITLNVHGLNAPTKRHRLAECIQK